MDSGNSSSMQSSSGGDDEYDSRADSITAFLNTPSSRLASLSHHHTRPMPTNSLHHHAPSSSSMLDPLSVYLDAFARSPPPHSDSNPLLNLDVPWAVPRGAVALDHPSCTDVISQLMGSAPPPSNTITTAAVAPSRGLYAGGISTGAPVLSSCPSLLQQPSSFPPPGDPPSAGTTAPPRSSKKRSRASRRASTTVLTTDTSNFRAMVQEFTGLPAPPFASSPFSRSRFDLFHAAASSVMRSSGVSETSPHFLLRPLPQKLPISFSSGSSSSSSSFPPALTGIIGSITNVTAAAAGSGIAATTGGTSTSVTSATANITPTATASAAISTNTASTSNYQLPSDLGLGTQDQNLLNMFNYQSLLQSCPTTKYDSSNVTFSISKKAPPGPASAPDYTIGAGIRQGHAGAHLGTIPGITEQMRIPSSRSGVVAGGGDGLLRWVEGSGSSERGDQGQFRPSGGSCTNSQRGDSCKLNYAGSASSEYHAEKGSENGSARGEGMVDSWICSSD